MLLSQQVPRAILLQLLTGHDGARVSDTFLLLILLLHVPTGLVWPGEEDLFGAGG